MRLYNWIKDNYALLIILFLASVLRFYKLDFQSPWLDEIYTLNEANPEYSVKEVYNAIMKAEQQPPLYFILINWTFRIFGYTSFAMRMFSALMGIFGVLGIYLLTKELSNKKAGLFAALLLAINYFHIYYSQEGRMYTFLVLTTVFCFYYFVRFLKNPGTKQVLLYMLSSTLMIYSHFFGLFVLLSQYLIFLFFIIRPYAISRGRFFLYCFLSGVASLILYIPALESLVKASEIKGGGGWIPVPGADVYTQMIKEYFGQSEIVLFFVVVLILVFINRVIKETEADNPLFAPNKDNLTFHFSVLMSWLLITMYIPFVRSYLVKPMITSRYLIEILPAIIILVALGLLYIKNRIAQYVILTIIVVFSLSDIIVAKNYYTQITKVQFREISDYVVDKNQKNDPVVSDMSRFLDYFINKGKTKTRLVEKTLVDYVDEIMTDTNKIVSFWYVRASTQDPKMPDTLQQKFLNKYFIIAHNKVGYYAWANHYELMPKSISGIDLSKYDRLKNGKSDIFTYYIDAFDTKLDTIKSTGFAFFEGHDSKSSEIEIVLVAKDKAFNIYSQMERRNDLTQYFNSKADLSNSGYKFKLSKKWLPAGKYRLGIILKNKEEKKEGLMLTDYYYTKN